MANQTLHPVVRALAAQLEKLTGDFAIPEAISTRISETLRTARDAETIAIHLLALADAFIGTAGAERVVDQLIELIAPVLARTAQGRASLDALEAARHRVALDDPSSESKTAAALEAPRGGASIGLRRNRR